MTGRERTPPLALGPELDFLRTVWRLNHAVERVSADMARTLGVTAQQRLALRIIGKFPGITPGMLAELLHLDPGTVSATLRRLESRGLVQRRRDHRDRRRVVLGLTAAGRQLDRPTEGTLEAAVAQLLRPGDARALGHAADTLVRLAVLLEKRPLTSTGRRRRAAP
ncbi:MAG: MarR family transcriptional regulator [Deltaproteobacteria bacterium]|nr:MarR family transcriptional regulator [Deltaproteobacteria bacterium]